MQVLLHTRWKDVLQMRSIYGCVNYSSVKQSLVASGHRSFHALHRLMFNSHLFNVEINYLGPLQITKIYGQIDCLHFSATKSVIHLRLCLLLSFVYNITDDLLHVKCMQSYECQLSTSIPCCFKFLSIFL